MRKKVSRLLPPASCLFWEYYFKMGPISCSSYVELVIQLLPGVFQRILDNYLETIVATSLLITLLLYNIPLQKEKVFDVVRLGDRGGQEIVLPMPVRKMGCCATLRKCVSPPYQRNVNRSVKI
jgi:hypothetical protein